MENLIKIFEDIKDTFCSLWTTKVHGKTLEIITPFSTTTSKFVSVFLTVQNTQFVVTDGGWIHNGEYESKIDTNDDALERLIYHYEAYYDILSTERKDGLKYYFKTTNKSELIPNLVLDLTNFISSIASAAQIQFQDEKEIKERENFKSAADNFISSINGEGVLWFNRELSSEYKVRFNAMITLNNKLKLVKYITGSTPDYFIRSISKATTDFEIANASPFNPYIKNKVALINDVASGFNESKIFLYIGLLEQHIQHQVVRWSNKEELKLLL
jgi:hypothetical protein